MKKRLYLAIRNPTFLAIVALLYLLSLSSFRTGNILLERDYPSHLIRNMGKYSKKLPEKKSSHRNIRHHKTIPTNPYLTINRKSRYSGNDPIHFAFFSNKTRVSVGEELEITITAQLIAIHPGLLAVFPGSNAFSVKVILPNGFVQTGGDYVDLIGTELSSNHKTVTYTLKGKFIIAPQDFSFRLLRSHKDAGSDSKFVEKGNIRIPCQNSVEINTVANSSKEARLAVLEVVCTPFSELCSDNTQELRSQIITVVQSGVYSIAFNYRSTEKIVSGIVKIDGVAQNVTFPLTSAYQNITIGTVSLSAGAHTIALSSGTTGGYICFNNICLTSTTPISPSCDYNITASSSNASPLCGAAISLSANCSGNDCNGVSYTWSNGQNGQSVNTNALSSNGSTIYTVTASKAGCTSKTAQANVTVSGCNSGVLSGCYLIRSKKTGQLLQALSGDVVEQRPANNQSNQIWKAESVGTNQYRFTTQDGSSKSMLVNAASQGQLVRIGTYTGTDSQKWNLLSDNTGSYKISTPTGITWDLIDYGVGPQLQLWGNANEAFADQRLFGFESAGCQVTTVSCNYNITATSSNANPLCGAAISLSANCSGNDCNGVGYTWSNGQNGQSLNTNAPGSNGTTNYTVTVSKSGCINQIASTKLTVSSCSTLNYQDMGRAGTRRDQFDIAKSSAQNGTIGISDISNYNVNGYNTLYFVNDVYIGSTLSSYQLPVNAKYVLDKLITKSNVTSGYQRLDDLWKQNSQDSQWIRSWHQQIIDTYDASTFVGDQTIGGGKGKLLPLYETWFIRSNNWNTEALRNTAPLALPFGKVFGGDPLDATANLADYYSHGWNMIRRTQINGQDLPLNERLVMPNSDDFHRSLQNSYAANKNYSNGNPTYEQGIAAQDNAGIDGFRWLIDQVGEGEKYILGGSDGYLAYHERFKQRNPTGHTFGNYSSNSFRYRAFSYNFQPLGGGARNPLDFNNYLRPYQSQQQARTRANGNTDPFYSDHGGKSLSSVGVEQLLNYYPFDVNEVDVIYVKLHEMDIMLKQDPNNKPIGYFWPLRENPAKDKAIGGDASSGQNSYEWEHETTNPTGLVRQKSHSICSLIAAEVFAFDAMTRGKGLVYFHNQPLTGNDRNKIGSSGNALYPATWTPNPGNTSTFPFVSSSEGVVPLSPLVGFDASYHGRIKAQRALDWLGTTTPNWEYATYSSNGSTRNAPSDGSAILRHASDYKPMVMILRNENKRVVWAFDPYCQPNAVQTINVNLNDGIGTSIDLVLKGNALHVILIN
jgi:hypothetical protein